MADKNYIREAAKHLPGRWMKGYSADDRGNFCGIGWVGEVVTKDHGTSVACWPLFDVMDKIAVEQYPDRVTEPGDSHTGIRLFAQFNDHPETTKDEVVAVMEKAAVAWEEKV